MLKDSITFMPTSSVAVIFSILCSALKKGEAVLGRLALYILALKSSCHDINSLTFSVNQKSESLLTHLKRQMESEKEHIACEFIE